ncbi:MAG: hypothetical protein GY716_14665 [bacterium]|nr:hypothetical protein [bacterium]
MRKAKVVLWVLAVAAIGGGLCHADDVAHGIDFSVDHPQVAGIVLYPQNVYSDLPGPPGVVQAFPTQLPGTINLDALDVTGPDEYKFSVKAPAFVFTPGGPLMLTPADVYVRGAGGAIAVDLNWSAEGIGLQSLNALDMIDADLYLFSVDTPQMVVDGTGVLSILKRSGVYSYDRTTGAIVEMLDAAALGMPNVDGVDLLPDGRLALSSASAGVAWLPGGPLIVYPAQVYIFDPGAGAPNLTLAYDGSAAGLWGIDGFTLIRPEGSTELDCEGLVLDNSRLFNCPDAAPEGACAIEVSNSYMTYTDPNFTCNTVCADLELSCIAAFDGDFSFCTPYSAAQDCSITLPNIGEQPDMQCHCGP